MCVLYIDCAEVPIIILPTVVVSYQIYTLVDPAAAIDGLLVQVNANNTNKQFAIVKYIILLCELFFFIFAYCLLHL